VAKIRKIFKSSKLFGGKIKIYDIIISFLSNKIPVILLSTIKQAFNYLSRYKGIDFIDKHYDENTQLPYT